MRAPPAISVQCRSSLAWRGLQALIFGSVAAVVAAWAAWHARLPAAAYAAACSAAGALCALFGWVSSRGPAGQLEWTGSRWQWCSADAHRAAAQALDGAPDIMIDLEQWMLLRVRLAEGRRVVWLPVSRGDNLGPWVAWRAAVYSPASRPGTRSQPERPLS